MVARMINFLKADLYKLVKARRFLYIQGLFMLVLAGLGGYAYHSDHSPKTIALSLTIVSAFIIIALVNFTNHYIGEDFSNRTINNVISKQKNRMSIYLYKVFVIALSDIIYIFITYLLTACFRMIFGAQVDFSLIMNFFVHQVPLFICISLLCDLIFFVVKKANQGYSLFYCLAFLFDQLAKLILGFTKIDIPNDYFLFTEVNNGIKISQKSIIIAIVFTIIYLIIGYILFGKKEFK